MPSVVLLLLLLLLTTSCTVAVVDGNNKLIYSSSSSSAVTAEATAVATSVDAATPESKQHQQHQLRRRRRRAVELGEVEEPDQKEHYYNTNAIDSKIKMNRIVGGQNIEPTDRYPWFARVIGNKPDGSGLDACGGSLIAPDLVLTAAHCTEPTKIYLGVYDLDNKPNDSGYDVIANVRHPLYGTGNYSIDYNIMISQLAIPVPSIIAQPIRLNFDPHYPTEDTDNGLDLTMIGFGSVIGGSETGLPNPPNQQSSILKKANTNYVPLATCAISKDPNTGVVYGVDYPQRTSVKENWFCTIDEVTATCFGDGGGPIIKEHYFSNFNNKNDNNNNNHQDTDTDTDLLLAVISGASGYCGNKHLPLWNSRISFHKEWILYWGCQLSGGDSIGSNTAPKEWNCTKKDDDSSNSNNNNIGSTIISKSNVPIDNNVYYNKLDELDDTDDDDENVVLETNSNGVITDAPTISITTIRTTLPSSEPIIATTATVTVTDAPTTAIATTNKPPTLSIATTNEPTLWTTLLLLLLLHLL